MSVEKKYALCSILICFFIAITSQLSTAITIGFAAYSFGEIGQLANAFTLTLMGTVVGLPLFSRLIDLKGSHYIYKRSLLLFCISAFLTGFAPSYALVELGAFFIGIFGTPLIPILNPMMNTVFSQNERSKLIVYIGLTLGSSLLFGPLIVGLLNYYFGWRFGLWLNVPIALLSYWLIHPYDSNEKSSEPQSIFDMTSGIVFTLSIAVFTFWLRNIGYWGLNSLFSYCMLTILVILIISFYLRERKLTNGFLQIKDFEQTPVLFFILFNVFTGSILFYYMTLGSLSGIIRMQDVLSGLGMTMVPLVIGLSFGIVLCPKILARIPLSTFIKIDSVFIVILAIVTSFSWNVLPASIVAILFFLNGLAIGLINPGINSNIYASSPPHRQLGSTTLGYFVFKMGGITLLSCLSYLLHHWLQGYFQRVNYTGSVSFTQMLSKSSVLHSAAMDSLQRGYYFYSIYLLGISFLFVAVLFLRKSNVIMKVKRFFEYKFYLSKE
ncbi:MFS transporter [Bacillus sp. FJAT-47783]|uniref:MFS transporter n=1 Tax=Bacillus sp. FJAT-47783 TaxID=2922712 RepID=UPI001FAB8439|nr:MFS transporter [Bacillus sp. FJAT-47783]